MLRPKSSQWLWRRGLYIYKNMGPVFISFVNGVMGSLRGFRGDIEAAGVLKMGSRHNFLLCSLLSIRRYSRCTTSGVIKNIKHVDVIRKPYFHLGFNTLYMPSSLPVILP
jgi:hypothetical protein